MKNSQFILKHIIDDLKLAQPAQVGVDLTLDKVFKLNDQRSFRIPNDNNSVDEKYMVISKEFEIDKGGYFYITKGVYSIEFDQGLKPLPKDNTAYIIQRSTLARNGIVIRSSIYDPGFATPKMGAMMYVFTEGFIQKHTRIAQIIFLENEEASLYEGQYQNKITR